MTDRVPGFESLELPPEALAALNVPSPADLSAVDDSQRDEHFMRLALREALAAWQLGEVPVGAVLVQSRTRVIATGFNLREHRDDPTAHAELVAIVPGAHALGRWRLDDCELYVTLEPCPMCAGALVNARIGRVIFGCTDPKAGACGTVLALHNHPVLNHRYPVTGGVLAPACAAVLTAFFRQRR